jgi:hypothetical protein
MNKKIISEIKRLKVLMGVNLISEGIPGALTDLLTSVFPGKQLDELSGIFGAAARRAGVPTTVIDEIIDVLDNPDLYDGLTSQVKRQMFRVFSEVDELAPELYNGILDEIGVTAPDVITALSSKMKKILQNAETNGTPISNDEAYQQALEEVLGEGGPTEVIELFKKQNFDAVISAATNKVNKYANLSDVKLDQLLVEFKTKANKADWSPSEDNFDLVEVLISRKKMTSRQWQEILGSKVPGFNEVIRLNDAYRLGVSDGSIAKSLSFEDWLIETASTRLPGLWTKNGATFTNKFIRPYKIIFGTIDSTATQKKGAWTRLLVDVGLFTGLLTTLFNMVKVGTDTTVKYLDNLTGVNAQKIKLRWDEYWTQDEPKLRLGATEESIYNQIDVQHNIGYKVNPPDIQVIDSANNLVQLLNDKKISIQGTLYNIVKFIMADTAFNIGEGSLFPDYITPSTVSSTNDIESFREFISRELDKNINNITNDMIKDEGDGIFSFTEGSDIVKFKKDGNTFTYVP